MAVVKFNKFIGLYDFVLSCTEQNFHVEKSPYLKKKIILTKIGKLSVISEERHPGNTWMRC